MSRALTLGMIAFLAGCEGDTGPPRHLVLITIDTLRADHLGCYGYERATSPTIDRLAAEGVLFENAFSPRGQTFPAIATLFTGRTPIETCALANGDRLPESERTLAEQLRDSGFRTAAFSANKLLVPGSGIEQGFGEFFHEESPDRDERVVAAAVGWLGTHDDQKGPRLFAWIHLVGPHLPYDPRPLDGIDFAQSFTNPGDGGEANGSRVFLDAAHTSGRELSAEEVRHVIALYDGEIARVDRLVGRLSAACSKMDALLVFTADHGEELYERNLYFGHSKSMYDSVLHVPLVFHHPRTIAHRIRESTIVELEDVCRTMLAELRAFSNPPISDNHWRSLGIPHLDGELAWDSDNRGAFGIWRDRIFTVRDEHWRLVWNPGRIEPQETPPGSYPVPEFALFDHATDPHELVNIAGVHPRVVGELREWIESWRSHLHPCTEPARAPTPQQIRALKDLGYAGDDR